MGQVFTLMKNYLGNYLDLMRSLFDTGPNDYCLRDKPLSIVNNHAEFDLPFTFWNTHHHKLLIFLYHYNLKAIISFSSCNFKVNSNTNFRKKTLEYFLTLLLLMAFFLENMYGKDKRKKNNNNNKK